MNSSPDAPWKGGRERSDRWRETLNKGFPPRVSDGTGSPGPGGCGRPKRRPNGDVILIIALILDVSGEKSQPQTGFSLISRRSFVIIPDNTMAGF
jgi:hypothetical protein